MTSPPLFRHSLRAADNLVVPGTQRNRQQLPGSRNHFHFSAPLSQNSAFTVVVPAQDNHTAPALPTQGARMWGDLKDATFSPHFSLVSPEHVQGTHGYHHHHEAEGKTSQENVLREWEQGHRPPTDRGSRGAEFPLRLWRTDWCPRSLWRPVCNWTSS